MTNNLVQPEDVLSFWYGDDPADIFARAEYWFKKDPNFDREIQDKFEPTLIAATAGNIDNWKSAALNRLAYIILLDQFSRNIYRDTPKMFSQDPLALSASLEGQEEGLDRGLSEYQRNFFYMPMMHSEDLQVQRKSIEVFRRLADEAHPDLKKSLEMTHSYAIKHFEIVESFGRFPHRNKILGRESTPAELEFLEQPGSSF